MPAATGPLFKPILKQNDGEIKSAKESLSLEATCKFSHKVELKRSTCTATSAWFGTKSGSPQVSKYLKPVDFIFSTPCPKD